VVPAIRHNFLPFRGVLKRNLRLGQPKETTGVAGTGLDHPKAPTRTAGSLSASERIVIRGRSLASAQLGMPESSNPAASSRRAFLMHAAHELESLFRDICSKYSSFSHVTFNVTVQPSIDQGRASSQPADGVDDIVGLLVLDSDEQWNEIQRAIADSLSIISAVSAVTDDIAPTSIERRRGVCVIPPQVKSPGWDDRGDLPKMFALVVETNPGAGARNVGDSRSAPAERSSDPKPGMTIAITHSPQTGSSSSGRADSGRSITLLLSGGGYRATLFHIGLLRFFYEHSLVPGGPSLLTLVNRVVGVSGGSITAAHLALHYGRYCADSSRQPRITPPISQANDRTMIKYARLSAIANSGPDSALAALSCVSCSAAQGRDSLLALFYFPNPRRTVDRGASILLSTGMLQGANGATCRGNLSGAVAAFYEAAIAG
jgi:hypothetical protein